MSCDLYLGKCRESLAVLGWICIRTLFGLAEQDTLEKEILRVLGLLRRERRFCCTTRFIQKHYMIGDPAFAYVLLYEFARK